MGLPHISKPKPSFTVSVDVTNPGQFFACCGLLELAHRSAPAAGVEAWFAGDTFCVADPCHKGGALKRLLERLRDAKTSEDVTRGDGATHPVYVEPFGLILDWWIDNHGRKTHLKLWAGQQTSLGIVNGLRDALPPSDDARGETLVDCNRFLSGRFGVDPRAAWNALDVGFSPNTQQLPVATSPVVELLAAVGLQRFRPLADRVGFRYATWTVALPLCVASAAGMGLLSAAHLRSFRFQIATRGSYRGFEYATPIGDQA